MTRPRSMVALLASLVVLGLSVVSSFMYLLPEAPGSQRTITQLARLANDGKVDRARVLDEDARLAVLLREDLGRVWTAYPKADLTAGRLIQDLGAKDVDVSVDPQTSKAIVRTVLTILLPLMILANLFALFFVSSRGGGTALGEVVSFGRIARGQSREGATRGTATFGDVAGLDEAVLELREVVDYLTHPERYRALGAAPPKGVLLFGPPGCGKTLLARAVAGEAEVPFFAVAGAEFVESLVGVGAARVRDLFARVRAVAPAIVFIDELDAAGRRRGGAASGGGSDERDQTLNQLLVEMDGFEISSGIVVIAATNRPDILDPALLRPGRFDRHITVDRPDLERRMAILELHAKPKPVEAGVDFALLARQTPGFSGADLASVVNEAALLTIRESDDTLTPGRFYEAVQRVRSGPQRKGVVLTPAEARRVAAYEAGNAMLLALTGRADEVHRLSIVTRSGAHLLPLEREDDEALLTRAQIEEKMAAYFGGRAAEELLLGQPTSGAEHDLARATSLAIDLVARYGLSEALGPRRLVASDGDAAWADSPVLGDLSQETHALVDAEVARELDRAHRRARELLTGSRAGLVTLVDKLVDEETLEGAELAGLLPRPASAPKRRRAAAASSRPSRSRLEGTRRA